MSKISSVSEEVRDDARVLTIRGELDPQGADEVRVALERATTDRSRPLVIDLSDCSFIDSTGLATIVHLTRPMRDDPRGVTLVCSEGEVRKLLRLSALDLTFPIFDRLAAALGWSLSER